MSPARPAFLGFAEAVALLQTPDAGESWSPVLGTAALVIDCGRAPSPSPDAVTAAMARLAELPCPSIALLQAAPPGINAFAAAADVAVDIHDELDAVLTGIMRAPLAAATLVQVLRIGARLPAAEALTIESLAYATLQGGREFAAWLEERGPATTATPPSTPPLRLERAAARLMITLDRSARHNAFSAAMRDALTEALTFAAADPEIAEIVLRGAGPSFCSGGDLDEFGTTPDATTAHAIRILRSPARLLATLGPRVRAEVHGACIGAGIELAAFATHVTAAPNAFFQLPEVGMGLIPGAGGTVSIPRRIGRQRTAELALTGRRVDAATAQAWGLVDRITDAIVS